jgi:hypothetical protein
LNFLSRKGIGFLLTALAVVDLGILLAGFNCAARFAGFSLLAAFCGPICAALADGLVPLIFLEGGATSCFGLTGFGGAAEIKLGVGVCLFLGILFCVLVLGVFPFSGGKLA